MDDWPPDPKSGRILLRMPSTLHARLVEAAEVEGVSLNLFMCGVLAGAVHWETPVANKPTAKMRRDLEWQLWLERGG